MDKQEKTVVYSAGYLKHLVQQYLFESYLQLSQLIKKQEQEGKLNEELTISTFSIILFIQTFIDYMEQLECGEDIGDVLREIVKTGEQAIETKRKQMGQCKDFRNYRKGIRKLMKVANNKLLKLPVVDEKMKKAQVRFLEREAKNDREGKE